MSRALRAGLFAMATAANPAHAAPEDFIVDPRHTFPAFAVDHLGISTQTGRFDRTRGRIVLDREAGTGTIDIVIDASSMSTGNAQLDEVIRGEDFLNAAAHGELRFRGHIVEFAGDAPRLARGELTMAGATRPVELRVTRFGCTRLPFLVRTTCGADVEASLLRSQFGMTAYAGFVGEEVRLRIQVEATRVEPEAPPMQGGS